MTKMLSREEVDKILERDKMGRPAKHEEILMLTKAIEERKHEIGMQLKDKLPQNEVEKIIKKLGFEDIEIKYG